jgi:hypothetical protein
MTKATLALAVLMATSMAFSQDDRDEGGSTPGETRPYSDRVIGTPGGTSTASPVIGTRDPGDVDLIIDITGANSWDALGAPVNETDSADIGTGGIMTGIGWDVTITTVGASWLSEAECIFSTIDSPGVFITPGAADGAPGTGSYSSGGVIDLSDNGIPDIPAVNGTIDMEFYESFDDVANAIDATWDSGTLTVRYTPGISVPTLGEYGMLAMILTLVGLGLYQIRRRKALMS